MVLSRDFFDRAIEFVERRPLHDPIAHCRFEGGQVRGGHPVFVPCPLRLRIIVHALQQSQHVSYARLLAIQIAELPDVSAVEILDHADDPRRLC